jgi:ABC-type lipoprotein export system ATPase subunit
VAGVDLTVEPGEMVAIVGPSGCGKTTLLQLCGLLLKADAGRLSIAGAEVTSLNDDARAALRRRHLGFVFQSFNLLPQFDAIDNVRIARPDRPDAAQRARDLLIRLGLESRLNHRPSQLSAGEQQRVAIARAWINEPSVLLADEPTGNLDSEREGEILDLLREATGRGQAVVLVTHSAAVAARADRVLAMRDGRLEGTTPGLHAIRVALDGIPA